MDAEEIDVEEEEMEVEEVEEEEEEEDPEEEELIEEVEEEVIEEEEEDPEEEELIEEVEGEVIEEVEEEEDPEEEEEVVEVEEEEVVEVEEEGEEQANQDVEESCNSPSKPSDLQEDVERGSESNRLDGRLASCSSRTEEFKSCPELNSDVRVLKSTSPSDEQSTTLKDTCLSFENSEKELTLTEDKGTQDAWEDEKDSELPTGDSKVNNLSLENNDKPRPDNIELVSLGNTGISNTAGGKTCDSVPSSSGVGQRPNGACNSGNKRSNIKSEDENSGTVSGNRAGDKVSDSVPGGADICQKTDFACNSGKGRSNIIFEDEKRGIKSRPRSFSPGGEIKEPQQKRAGIVCDFFAKGWCIRGKSCRFLHVKDNSNNANQRQASNNVAGNSEIRPGEERITSDNRVSGKSCEAKQNSEASLHSREKIYVVNSQASQRFFSSKEDMGFMWSSKDMGRERLKQNFGADGLENRSLFFNGGDPSIPRSSSVHGHRSSVSSSSKLDIVPSQPAWTRSFHTSVSASGGQGQFDSGNKFYGSESLSHRDPEGNAASKKAKVTSNDWEPSEPFRPSFVIPPSILPPCSTMYDPFLDGMDAQNLEDDLLNDSVSSKGEHTQKTSHHHKDGDSGSGPQAEDCNDDKSSSCSQNQYQEAAPEKNSEIHEMEMMATSVVEQNEVNPKKGKSSGPAHKKDVKRSRPAGGYDAWRKSNMSSNIKIARADKATDDVDGEVRSDAGMKVMRNFRTALIENIKELLKPIWREGRLSKDVHNMIVKKAVEKGYVEKFRKS
ncbi:PREDICTED: protein FRIGIDA-ESSENTIAL 1 isoform X2 [Tarenaya hassleriana]|uniref:protein FRIGIDA-ESSENTIAL 1 isoform X2 n=1 Tax=Tarenaya hassleriana TaxID=28532 RepID=UPI00053C82F9|nr:PREDICTED: protein FRIGIDA-ESSENTIAL 1 isoform X2 [Tarenaya hassleriana]